MPATMLLTVEETATQLRIARRRVFEMIRDGSLPSVKIGRSRRIRSSDLAAYVANLEPADAQMTKTDASLSA
jgi:excisionase family DNA binding protein